MSDKLLEMVTDLRSKMILSPSGINHELIKQGKKSLSIFSTQDFGRAVSGFEKILFDLHMDAIFDLSHGGAQLAAEKFGVALRSNDRLVRFSVPASDPIPHSMGKIVCSIALNLEKNSNRKTRKLTQDQTNAGIYYLIYRLAQLRK